MSYCHQQAFSAMLRQLAPTAAGISVDELPSLLWAGAQLASATAAPVVDFSSNMCEQAGQGQRQLCAVPVNDGINGSVSSSKIARLPGVVDFLLGAAQNLTGGVRHNMSSHNMLLNTVQTSCRIDGFLKFIYCRAQPVARTGCWCLEALSGPVKRDGFMTINCRVRWV
jgi:hypothetical protein